LYIAVVTKMFRLALKVGMVVLMEYLNSGVHADEKQQIVV